MRGVQTMKKVLTVAMLLMLSVAMYAQNDVTKFLGIPVDGSKADMIQKLKAKGFTYDSENDCLLGEFNDHNVWISIVTTKNKVWRIVVLDAVSRDEGDIKIEFNKLCSQFKNNKKYIPLSDDFTIPDDENIFHEMLVNNKRYEADYCQVPAGTDINALTKEKLNERCLHNAVWFRIGKDKNEHRKYRIGIYYDNKHNLSNGDDL